MKQIDIRKTGLALIIGILPAMISGMVNKPFRHTFINVNFLCGLLMLAVGFFLYCRNKGDFDIMSYRPKDGMSYGEYRQQKAEERADKPLPFLLVTALFQLAYTILLNVFL